MSEVLLENGYIDAFVKKYDQLVFLDEYGEIDIDAYSREVDRFVKKHYKKISILYSSKIKFKYKEYARKYGSSKLKFYVPRTGSMYEKESVVSLSYLIKMCGCIKSKYDSTCVSNQAECSSTTGINGFEYELYVQKKFNQYGWESFCTKKTGDQGADVVAKKSNFTIVVQCKRYSKPVGNKAVQEAYAAKSYYNADRAIVVTNNAYTKPAMQLAQNLGILLIGDEDIKNIDTLLGLS